MMAPEIEQNKTKVRERKEKKNPTYYEFVFNDDTSEDSVNVRRCSEFSISWNSSSEKSSIELLVSLIYLLIVDNGRLK
jgi:hypothetical protein